MISTFRWAVGAIAVSLIGMLGALAAEAQTRRGSVKTTVSAPKLVSTNVTETRRVTTEVGRPKVQTRVTRVATRIEALPPTTPSALAVMPGSRPTLALPQANERTLTPGIRDMGRTRFRTGDFFE